MRRRGPRGGGTGGGGPRSWRPRRLGARRCALSSGRGRCPAGGDRCAHREGAPQESRRPGCGAGCGPRAHDRRPWLPRRAGGGRRTPLPASLRVGPDRARQPGASRDPVRRARRRCRGRRRDGGSARPRAGGPGCGPRRGPRPCRAGGVVPAAGACRSLCSARSTVEARPEPAARRRRRASGDRTRCRAPWHGCRLPGARSAPELRRSARPAVRSPARSSEERPVGRHRPTRRAPVARSVADPGPCRARAAPGRSHRGPPDPRPCRSGAPGSRSRPSPGRRRRRPVGRRGGGRRRNGYRPGGRRPAVPPAAAGAVEEVGSERSAPAVSPLRTARWSTTGRAGARSRTDREVNGRCRQGGAHVDGRSPECSHRFGTAPSDGTGFGDAW
ncbi:hypothetical protein Psed_3617 [Pseudonocardia dioxanivorans CB1190]|uniref:Uncharacterized protein n=1 Tax=Pseudonocardia dioxanivorans (strain ATCC 55486 / DSM 44775 / JCM 13855 / CB1190) TaxID=675635 RepID=F4D0T6_PSEUX|nr:hypothetical protein Psed_3617 [Pseudonocardia dioxanivorans CB1190]